MAGEQHARDEVERMETARAGDFGKYLALIGREIKARKKAEAQVAALSSQIEQLEIALRDLPCGCHEDGLAFLVECARCKALAAVSAGLDTNTATSHDADEPRWNDTCREYEADCVCGWHYTAQDHDDVELAIAAHLEPRP